MTRYKAIMMLPGDGMNFAGYFVVSTSKVKRRGARRTSSFHSPFSTACCGFSLDEQPERHGVVGEDGVVVPRSFQLKSVPLRESPASVCACGSPPESRLSCSWLGERLEVAWSPRPWWRSRVHHIAASPPSAPCWFCICSPSVPSLLPVRPARRPVVVGPRL